MPAIQLSFNILGFCVQALTKHDLVFMTGEAIQAKERLVIGNHNLHSLYLCTVDRRMHAFYSLADYTHIDGMSLVLFGRLLGAPLLSHHRTQYVDLLPLLAAAAERAGWRIFYLGSEPGVAETAVDNLKRSFPRLQIETHSGYFDATQTSDQNRDVLAKIRTFDADIVMVGMGMPRQELWVTENIGDLGNTVVFCCGAMMDFIAGRKSVAPRFLGPLGLEWLFRLCSEPGRLWRRYLIEPWIIIFALVREFFRSGRVTLLPESPDFDKTTS